MKVAYCRHCDEEIEETVFLAVSSVAQHQSGTTTGCEPLMDAWKRIHSDYYHKNCLAELAGEDFVDKVVNPPLEERDFKKMVKLAGV